MDEASVRTNLVPEIMPAEAVAEVLGVSEQDLEALTEAGLAPGVRIQAVRCYSNTRHSWGGSVDCASRV